MIKEKLIVKTLFLMSGNKLVCTVKKPFEWICAPLGLYMEYIIHSHNNEPPL